MRAIDKRRELLKHVDATRTRFNLSRHLDKVLPMSAVEKRALITIRSYNRRLNKLSDKITTLRDLTREAIFFGKDDEAVLRAVKWLEAAFRELRL